MKINGYVDSIELIPETDDEAVAINEFFVALQNMKSASGKSAHGEIQVIKTERPIYPKYTFDIK